MEKLTTAEFQAVTKQDTPTLVEFHAPWCVHCRRIAPALEELTAQYADRVTFGQVNIDDAPQLAQAEKIEVIPTFVLYRGGRRLGSTTAPESKAALEAFLKRGLQGESARADDL